MTVQGIHGNSETPDKLESSAHGGKRPHYHLLGLLPCPVKVPMQQAFNEFLAGQSTDLRNKTMILEGHANFHLSFYEQFDNIDQAVLPDILITPGINKLYGADFNRKFISARNYCTETDYLDHVYEQSELRDPTGVFDVLGFNVTVIVVNPERLDGRPVPQSWADLLKEDYENKVVMRSQKDFFCETTLLNICQLYGEKGLLDLARSVYHGYHPAEIAKHFGHGGRDWPPVAVMPYFFAKTIKPGNRVRIIWPREGAILSPVTMLVKKQALAEMLPVVRFFKGRVCSHIWSNAFFVPGFRTEDTRPEMAGPYQWVGWDFIRSSDVEQRINNLNRIFVERFCSLGKSLS